MRRITVQSNYEILLGDSLQVLQDIEDNSIDSIVTDPPYGLAFMNKKWDYDVPSVGLWKEVLRVLKPGGHLLSFGGTRTYHRMVVNIEDAGFEIRDQIQWLYGSGFPKSHNLSKAMDKKAGAKREVIGDKTFADGSKARRTQNLGTNVFNDPKSRDSNLKITAPSTNAAKHWNGWGTALKPANEPIVLARKPLSEKTIVDNVLKWGTGGLNIDVSRVELEGGEQTHGSGASQSNNNNVAYGSMKNKRVGVPNIKSTQGRWPANVILDEAAGEMLDEQSGITTEKARVITIKPNDSIGTFKTKERQTKVHGGTGGASRFFYCAKASKSERNAGLDDMVNDHCTVKPIKLMAYLCKLITPPNGIILDPFMGSGTTGIAAISNGFRFMGIERESEYIEIAARRIENAEDLFNTTA